MWRDGAFLLQVVPRVLVGAYDDNFLVRGGSRVLVQRWREAGRGVSGHHHGSRPELVARTPFLSSETCRFRIRTNGDAVR